MKGRTCNYLCVSSINLFSLKARERLRQDEKCTNHIFFNSFKMIFFLFFFKFSWEMNPNVM